MKITIILSLLLAFAVSAIGQQAQPEANSCADLARAKSMYRTATPSVKANMWTVHLLTIRADGKRTPEQIASIDETLPLITADVFNNGKKKVPDDVILRSLDAFKDEKWLLSTVGTDAELYLAKHIPLLTVQTVSATLPPHCYCRVDWGCNLGYKNTSSECVTYLANGCIRDIEGCGWLWLQGCDGLCAG